MKTKLDKLLDRIDPAVTIDKVSARVDMAFNSFHARPEIISQRDEFRSVMANFYCHIENTVLNLNPPRKPDLKFDWGRCDYQLEKEYGPNGENIAFDMARTNIGGGLYAVLKAVASQMADEYSGNEISSHVSEFWHALSVNEQLAIPKEYLDKYGHLIPSELREDGAVRVRMLFWKTLEEHPRIIKRLRDIGRL